MNHFCTDTLNARDQMSNWEALTSENGKFNAKVSLGGELIVRMVQGSPEWRTNVELEIEKGPYILRMKNDNELVVLTKDLEIKWRSNTRINHPLARTGFVKMENNGKLTIYRGDGKPIWKSGINEGTTKFEK